MQSRPTIAQVCDKYLPLSETFIHQSLQNMERTRPVVTCSVRENAEAFPAAEVWQVSYPRRISWERARSIALRTSGLNPAADAMEGAYYQIFARHRPDLVHAHFGPIGCRAMSACQKLNLPLVVSFYGYDLSSLVLEERWRKAYKALFQTAHALIALSEDFRRRLIELGCAPEKIHVVRLGVDPAQFVFRPPVSTLPPRINLICVSRCVEKKGVGYTLQALAKVREEFPGLHYVHIGDGPLLEQWKNEANTLGIEDRCEWVGKQSREFVRTAMQNAHLFILPSVRAANGDEEGTPTVLYEAMAIGLPVLSTFHSGIPEMIADGKNGYLAPERDADALAQNMRRLLQNVSEWPDMAAYGRQRIETEFDVRSETAKLEALYFRLFEGTQLSGSGKD